MSQATRAAAAEAYRRRSRTQRLLASLRDTWLLVREFRDALILWIAILLLGAASFTPLWNLSHEEPMRFVEALFHMLTMMFLQPVLDFPREWYLDIYFFLMPLLGLMALARGVTNFFVLLFNRQARQAQWEVAVASIMKNHIVVVGLGHLGIRVVRELVRLGEDVAVIERNPDPTRLTEARSYSIPVIIGDGRDAEVLKQAGVERASALIICTNDDLANLQIASRVRELDKDIRLVMRLFDDEFSVPMAERFDIAAVMSASAMAAPAFAGAATGTEILQTFKVADQVLALGRIEVQPRARLVGQRVGDVEQGLKVSIVLLQSQGQVILQPPPNTAIQERDVLSVVGALEGIRALASQWNRPERRRRG